MSIWKNEKFWCVVGGAIGSAIAKKILKAPKTREYAVKGLAHGMKFTADAKATFQDMKDEAADICNDAKNEAGLK
ncbi:MAG: DUF1490 domain-containing protein [Fibrobacter sp.]|jgi:hypothetical protein|nr:DUF1490 domain-containing protein [Fibrobacter sp.]MBR6833058.1 DUF1490 domain-containing protein [Fibrobacter sp.]